MDPKRIDYFNAKYSYNEKFDLSSKDFTVSEINEIINETVLNNDERIIAKEKYLNDKTIQEISDIVNLSEKTVQRKIPIISKKLKSTIQKIVL